LYNFSLSLFGSKFCTVVRVAVCITAGSVVVVGVEGVGGVVGFKGFVGVGGVEGIEFDVSGLEVFGIIVLMNFFLKKIKIFIELICYA
jgi:hypothetical protein